MTKDETILAMLREVQDPRIPRVACWADTFGRTVEEMQALFDLAFAEALEEVA